jgi:hypothetical protein
MATKKSTTTKKSPAKKSSAKSSVKKSSTRKPRVKKTTILQEENHYGRTMLAALLIIVICVGGYFWVQHKNASGDKNYQPTKDEAKFIDEYESLNGKKDSNGNDYIKVSVLKNNNIVYASSSEIINMLDSGTGVIYFGYAEDTASRIAVPILLNAMDSSNLDKIYYLNIREKGEDSDIRDIYTLNKKNKARETKEGTKDYYSIRLALANHLHDYILYTSDGKAVNTGEKRLNTPTLVAVVNGEIVGFHEGIYSEYKANESAKKLSKTQEKELLNKYLEVISSYLNNDCNDDKEGDC